MTNPSDEYFDLMNTMRGHETSYINKLQKKYSTYSFEDAKNIYYTAVTTFWDQLNALGEDPVQKLCELRDGTLPPSHFLIWWGCFHNANRSHYRNWLKQTRIPTSDMPEGWESSLSAKSDQDRAFTDEQVSDLLEEIDDLRPLVRQVIAWYLMYDYEFKDQQKHPVFRSVNGRPGKKVHAAQIKEYFGLSAAKWDYEVLLVKKLLKERLARRWQHTKNIRLDTEFDDKWPPDGDAVLGITNPLT